MISAFWVYYNRGRDGGKVVVLAESAEHAEQLFRDEVDADSCVVTEIQQIAGPTVLTEVYVGLVPVTRRR